MTQFIDKSTVEIKNLYEDINKCIGDLVLARSKHDQRGISDTHWKMETLMVNTQQVLSYTLQHLEVKEVDLEKEVENWVKTGPHTSYPWCTIPDAIRITAEHFFELGLRAQKEE